MESETPKDGHPTSDPPICQIPLSSANGQLDEMIRHKRRLVVLNKSDLANTNMEQVCPSANVHISTIRDIIRDCRHFQDIHEHPDPRRA